MRRRNVSDVTCPGADAPATAAAAACTIILFVQRDAEGMMLERAPVPGLGTRPHRLVSTGP